MRATPRYVWGLLLGWWCLCIPASAHRGSCEDHTPDCTVWALRGACLYSPQFMRDNCPVSCNACVDPQCYDHDRRCAQWAKQGACILYPLRYINVCPHSCDACITPVFNRG